MAKFKKYKWRLYAERNIEKQIIDHLRKSNMDVLWIAEIPNFERQQDDIFHYKKAVELKRYLLTHDKGFWDDAKYDLRHSPGVIILAEKKIDLAKYLPVLLRKVILDYNSLPEPLYLDTFKIRLSAEGMTLKGIDHDTQKKTIEHWFWREII